MNYQNALAVLILVGVTACGPITFGDNPNDVKKEVNKQVPAGTPTDEAIQKMSDIDFACKGSGHSLICYRREVGFAHENHETIYLSLSADKSVVTGISDLQFLGQGM